jgi:Mg2+ and Co2+ transporter CorA
MSLTDASTEALAGMAERNRKRAANLRREAAGQMPCIHELAYAGQKMAANRISKQVNRSLRHADSLMRSAAKLEQKINRSKQP